MRKVKKEINRETKDIRKWSDAQEEITVSSSLNSSKRAVKILTGINLQEDQAEKLLDRNNTEETKLQLV